MSISTRDANGRAVLSRKFQETRIDPRDANASRISHLFHATASDVDAVQKSTVSETDDLYRRITIATAQRLSELGDQLRYGCTRQDCLAIRDAAHSAAGLLEFYEESEMVMPLCRALSRPQDDWDLMLSQAAKLLHVIEQFSKDLRSQFEAS